jgi:hypothetical protein
MNEREYYCKVSSIIFYQSYVNLFSIPSEQQRIITTIIKLDDLLEGTVDGRTEVGDALVEVNSGNSTLADALRSELELL